MKNLYKRIRFYFQKIFKLTKYLRGQSKYNLGKRTYIAENSQILNKNTTVGKFCSIAGHVIIGLGRKNLTTLSTHGFQYTHKCERLWGDLITPLDNVIKPCENKPNKIGNDCWICHASTIMDGIEIGDGAVVAAGAVVTKDVPPYAVVAGVPAKVVKYRFEQPIIDKLLELKWWDYPEDFIVRLPFEDIEKCIEVLEENRHLKE